LAGSFVFICSEGCGDNITMHLKKVYGVNELQEEATCKAFLQVQTEGTRRVERARKFYNREAIISIG
jgi:hypothetical protein